MSKPQYTRKFWATVYHLYGAPDVPRWSVLQSAVRITLNEQGS